MFSALSVYTITYRFDETKGIIAPEHRPTECTAGQSAVIGIQPRAGYETAFVTCNGVEMVADPRTGLYATPPVTEDITISVTFRAAENSGETDASAPDSGCGCGGALAGTLALSAAALAVFVKKPF